MDNTTKKKQSSGNRSEIRNGVLRKPIIKSSSETTTTPENFKFNLTDTSTHSETEVKHIMGEAVPVIEGSVVVTRIKNGSNSNPLFEKSSITKVKNYTVSAIKESKNEVKVPENVSVLKDDKYFIHAVNVTSDISIAETNLDKSIKKEALSSTTETLEHKRLHHVQSGKENKTTHKYNDNKNSLVDEILVTSEVIKDISGINEENHVIDLETSNEMLKDNKSRSQNQTLTKKTGEKEILLIGSDQTTNPFNFKTNSYDERYHSQWNIKNVPTPSYTLKPPQLQTEEPWRPILPYYTKHSPKPIQTYEYDDEVGTGVAEVLAIPPSAIENSAGDQLDNKFSSRLGQPVPGRIENKQPEFSSEY